MTDLILVRFGIGESEWCRKTPEGLKVHDSYMPKALGILFEELLSEMDFRVRLDWEAELVRHLEDRERKSRPGDVSQSLSEPSSPRAID
jgi:hypothetical protein